MDKKIQFKPILKSARNGFFQKDIDPSQEEVFRHGIVKRCGDSDTDSLNFIEKVCVMKEGLGSISFRDIPGTRDVNVHHTDQLHIIDVSVFFSMELAKVTDTDDTDLDFVHLTSDPPLGLLDEMEEVLDLWGLIDFVLSNLF